MAEIYAARRAAYRKLHEKGCFVQPNPWDAGTARWLRAKGFPALATTSAGYAWSRGRPEQRVPAEMMLGYIADMVDAVPDLPVNADFENGYGEDADSLARHVRACVETGVAGLSIEDATGRADQPLYDLDVAVERLKVARRAIDATGADVLLTARAEVFLTRHPTPLAEAVKRFRAFAAAGAEVLYAPGPSKPEDIAALIAAAEGLPVNIIVFADVGLSVADIAALGVRRISIGSALAKAAFSAFDKAAERIARDGLFDGFNGNMASSAINDFFEADMQKWPAGKASA